MILFSDRNFSKRIKITFLMIFENIGRISLKIEVAFAIFMQSGKSPFEKAMFIKMDILWHKASLNFK